MALTRFGRVRPSKLFVNDEIVEWIEAPPTTTLRPRDARIAGGVEPPLPFDQEVLLFLFG